MLETDDHLAACPSCRHATFSARAGEPVIVSLLDREDPARAGAHLSFEDQEGFIEHTLPEGVLNRVRRHLAACDDCAADVADLREFRAQMQAKWSAEAAIDMSPGAFRPAARRWWLFGQAPSAITTALAAVLVIVGWQMPAGMVYMDYTPSATQQAPTRAIDVSKLPLPPKGKPPVKKPPAKPAGDNTIAKPPVDTGRPGTDNGTRPPRPRPDTGPKTHGDGSGKPTPEPRPPKHGATKPPKPPAGQNSTLKGLAATIGQMNAKRGGFAVADIGSGAIGKGGEEYHETSTFGPLQPANTNIRATQPRFLMVVDQPGDTYEVHIRPSEGSDIVLTPPARGGSPMEFQLGRALRTGDYTWWVESPSRRLRSRAVAFYVISRSTANKVDAELRKIKGNTPEALLAELRVYQKYNLQTDFADVLKNPVWSTVPGASSTIARYRSR